MFLIFGAPNNCPVCTDFRFKRSTQGWIRHVAILIGLVPFRCMHCQNRVWRIAPFTRVPRKRRKGSGVTPITGTAVTPSDQTPPEGTTIPPAEQPAKDVPAG